MPRTTRSAQRTWYPGSPSTTRSACPSSYEAMTSKRNRSLAKEIVTTSIASIPGGVQLRSNSWCAILSGPMRLPRFPSRGGDSIINWARGEALEQHAGKELVAGEKEMSPARSCTAGRSDVVCWSFWRFLLRSREIGDELLAACRTAELGLSSTCSAGVAGEDLALQDRFVADWQHEWD